MVSPYRPHIWLLDPNSNTVPYDRALAAALAAAGAAVECLVSPSLYEPALPAAGYHWREYFFRLATGPLARRLGLAQHAGWRRLIKAGQYPLDWGALGWRRPDILHVQWSIMPALDRAIWRSYQRRGVPVVYTAHNLLPHRASSADSERYRRLYRTADALIVHTATTAARLADEFSLPRERIQVAPHGPLLMEEPPLARAAARRQLGLSAERPLILFAGLIEPYKGLEDLITAFIQLSVRWPLAQLVVAGKANMPLAALRQRLIGRGLADRAIFDLRYLPSATLAAYLCAADVVALPYRATTSSGLLMAAQRFACPIVATAVGDLAAVIADGETGLLVPPADPWALAAALDRLLAEPALATRLGQAGQQRVLTQASWSTAATATLALYQRLLAGR